MINFITGNLLESNAECLINTVNCEGYMGKGIAYQFKLKYPNNNRDYVKACKSGALKVGKLHYFKEDNKIIINFPTKDKWRQKSKIEYIIYGMDSLVNLLPILKVKSIAIPPLGCGNGGLEWNDVKSLIVTKLSEIKDEYDFYIYEPSSGYSIISPKEQPKLNVSSLVLMDIKLNLDKFNSLRLQKTAYFTNIFLGETYFRFKKHKYGPYDNAIPIISKGIKAFQTYYGTKNTKEAYEIAFRTIISEQSKNKLAYIKPAIYRACMYVNQIKTDKELECISTILFLIENNIVDNKEDVIKLFKGWSEDKASRFSEEDIKQGLEYLIKTNIISKTLVGYEINK
ncbi:MAG: macro domain-containing protein [Clostridium sp.]|nr:macro domain-containing protein [Clostridium sp.]